MPPPFFFSIRIPTLLAIWWLRFRRKIASGTHREPLSFLLIRLDSMGDVVLTTPLFRALKETNPKARVTVVVQAAYRSLLVTNPHVDEVLALPSVSTAWLPKGVSRLLAALGLYWTHLRYRRFDYVISPRWDVDEHLATFLCVVANAGKRVGYSCCTSSRKQRINEGFNAAFDVCLPPGPVQHEVERNLAISLALGARLQRSKLEVFITEKDKRRAAGRLDGVPPGHKLVAIGIGAASAGRRWPLSRYAEVLERLAQVQEIWPVILCSDEELGEALKLQARLRQRATIVSGAPLREVCAVLQRCELFIGNDSGCAHLAAAMKCRTLVVSRHPEGGNPDHFNSPVRFAPWGADVKVLQPATGRDGCKDACTELEPHCILNVSVVEVISQANCLLDRSPDSTSKAIDPRPLPRMSKGLSPIAAGSVIHAPITTMLDGTEGPLL